MTLDPDLLRDILGRLIDTPPNARLRVPEIEGRSQDEVFEHLELLADAGFIEAQPLAAMGGRGRIYAVNVVRVTYAGQEFFAAARNETLWAETKTTFRQRGLDFTLDLASRVLTGLAAAKLGLPG